ncbi:putative diacylglycerol acyltransferase type 2b [Serendipita vermifera]|nr:putative diacylglycerol acyltransferase type 2b [Serendipita vermifera]
MEQDHEIDPPKTTTLLKSLSATNLSKRLKMSPLGHSLTEIEFAPVNVPHHRRLQTAAVAFVVCLIPISQAFFLMMCAFPPLWPLILVYVVWVTFDEAPEKGGRRSLWVRSWRLWDYYASYFPASIKKEVDLPPDRPYLFGYHPHGIIGMGAIATFGTDGTKFSQHFPGITPYLMTLTSNFKLPLYRDLLMALGICSVSKKSCNYILQKGKGNAICIVIGGAAESLSAHPGTADLTLQNRVGFIKVAMQQGADLVPVFSFGENDIYEQMPNEKGTTLYSIQKHFQSIFGFTLPLFHGRGILNYTFGLMPYRRTIVSVFGRPIPVTKVEQPSMEKVLEVHALYIEELKRIWEKYKDQYARQRTKDLRII